MLTNDDLRKIGKLIDERLEVKLEEKLESKLEEKLSPIRKDIQSLKRNDRAIRKEMRLILRYLDRERVSHDKRITRIEDRLRLSPLE
jgi:hypothetical protein